MSFPHGIFHAAIAARQRRLRQKQDMIEEVEMTNYSPDDLENDWEFKIVRSERGAFRKPENFQRLLQEEAAAGWELIEKLDDRRVRFKRRKDARHRDEILPQGIDPYRTQFDPRASRSFVLVAIGLVTLIALAVWALVFGLDDSGNSSGAPSFLVVGNSIVIVLVFVIMLIAIIARRR
jgi:hypothetical protein